MSQVRRRPAAAVPILAVPIAPPLEATGPPQTGRGVRGQYVYWITMPMPTPEMIAAHDIKKPTDFTRQEFIDLGVEVHRALGIDPEEAACFQEPHANGDPHHNLLIRSKEQYKWRGVADRFRNEHKVYVNFAPHIKTWTDGVVYGKVPSDHKGPERLDHQVVQWAKVGRPTPLEQCLPKRFLEPGFVRQARLSSLAFFRPLRPAQASDRNRALGKGHRAQRAGRPRLVGVLLRQRLRKPTEQSLASDWGKGAGSPEDLDSRSLA